MYIRIKLILLCALTSPPARATPPPAAPRLPAPLARPAALVGEWRGDGLALTLRADGGYELTELTEPAESAEPAEPAAPAAPAAPASPPAARGLWWVWGARLCLSTGLAAACQLTHDAEARPPRLRVTLAGREVRLALRAPRAP